FITQTLIGGARLLYMPLFIYQQATGAQNWPLAAAAAVVFMASVLLVVALFNLLGRTRRARTYA
ncbi:MAG: ABC transporter permease, partial [Candidatus Rokubacteria bacterium]|nr:ABC transporter permease [Candidatus Rokubacteria bacterium]